MTSSNTRFVEAVRLIADRRDEMAAAARARAVERYSWEAVARRFDTALEGVGGLACNYDDG